MWQQLIVLSRRLKKSIKEHFMDVILLHDDFFIRCCQNVDDASFEYFIQIRPRGKNHIRDIYSTSKNN